MGRCENSREVQRCCMSVVKIGVEEVAPRIHRAHGEAVLKFLLSYLSGDTM